MQLKDLSQEEQLLLSTALLALKLALRSIEAGGQLDREPLAMVALAMMVGGPGRCVIRFGNQLELPLRGGSQMKGKQHTPTVRVPLVGWMAARFIVGRFKRAGMLVDMEAVAVHTFEQADRQVRRAAGEKPKAGPGPAPVLAPEQP